jgi:uncharacterized membrane protein
MLYGYAKIMSLIIHVMVVIGLITIVFNMIVESLIRKKKMEISDKLLITRAFSLGLISGMIIIAVIILIYVEVHRYGITH